MSDNPAEDALLILCEMLRNWKPPTKVKTWPVKPQPWTEADWEDHWKAKYSNEPR